MLVYCYGTSITTALERMGVNMSLIIAMLRGHIEGYKESKEGPRSSAGSTPSTPERSDQCQPYPHFSKSRCHVTST